MASYIPIFLMLAAAAGLGIILLTLHQVLGPKHPTEEKLSTYESGMSPIRTARERFSVKYYMVAVLFILFDIEVVFLYPWAVNFRALGVFGYVEMMIFIVILLVGYYYILRKGALKWD
ncbi:MAG: NADH-quinone oxidoreductase subunit A [Ignavibacteriales bacterium]|nr:NADH-quinone oxidoreductase subunit A [Ignavibacteriales bacterium]